MDRAPLLKTGSGPTSSGSTIKILGGGPAGTLAAITALRLGAAVEMAERARFPKHKVCGEFISGEIAPVLERAGLFSCFVARKPFAVRRMILHFGNRQKAARLPEPAYGFSRFALDHLLWSKAAQLGAAHRQEIEHADIIAAGRPAGTAVRGTRLFGFKAHFEGPCDDAVELFFLGSAYVGINCVEGERTNVCGLAPERLLQLHGFEPDSLIQTNTPLMRRLQPLGRAMKWIFTGPLEFHQRFSAVEAYRAGDALSFVDPFTGSGILCAALTGSLAGKHAVEKIPVQDHARACAAVIQRPFFVSSALRSIAGTDWAERLIGFVPARVLFRLTRPGHRQQGDGAMR